jgi:hypothetical protein
MTFKVYLYLFTSQQPGTQVIEFSSRPSKEEFLEVGYSSRPIIIRGAKAGSTTSSFNFGTLRQIFESEPGGIESVSEECQFLPFRSSFKNLHEVFQVNSDAREWEEPWYIGWYDCDLVVFRPLKLNPFSATCITFFQVKLSPRRRWKASYSISETGIPASGFGMLCN